MKRTLCIVGIGMGNPDTMTMEAQKAVENADALIGASRMLEPFLQLGKPSFSAILPEEIFRIANEHLEFERMAILMSGDVGFFSGTKKLISSLEGWEVRLIPGISSLVYFCARLGLRWDDVRWVSAHGRTEPILPTVRTCRKTFLLTGGSRPVQALCRELTDAGMGSLTVYTGENLSYPNEQILSGTAAEFSEKTFSSLAVMLVENPCPVEPEHSTHGIPDEAFLREKVPMTKFEVRCTAVSLLRVPAGGTVWDVGAGTGSVSVEAALANPGGTVWAVEQKQEAIELICRNREKFGAWNLVAIEGTAPEALEGLPPPDAVFIGGSSGNMQGIFESIRQKNPAARVVVSAITLETLAEAVDCFSKFRLADMEISQITAARAKEAGRYHLMMGQNPVYLISGQLQPEELQ